MGITGLIPFLEKATRKVTLKDLRGSTVGIDTYCWLHKGAISCADKLIRGDPTDLHIQYCLKYVNLLLSNNIKPVLVFDGCHLPAKALTEKRRSASRKDAKEMAKQLMREGKVNEARSYINRSVNITHEMAHQLIEECRKRNVDCIVAPYEADGQLGYLSRQKIIDYVITEDSDLTLFGCSKVIFKFDLTGNGLLFEADQLYQVMGFKQKDRFQFSKFEMMCILSGCDYLDSLRGVGLAKACKFVMMTEETDIKRCLGKVPQYLNLKGVTVEDEYKDGFLRALFTFRHMIVYDPKLRRQVRLTEPGEKDLPYCDNAGEMMPDDETAFQLAVGNVNPFTLKQMDTWDPQELNTDKYPSIWGQGSGTGGGGKRSTQVVITVNKTTTPVTSVTGSAKRKILKPPNDEDDEEQSHNTSLDIMNMYLDQPQGQEQERNKKETAVKMDVGMMESPPDRKKIRLSNPGSDRLERNPFLKVKKKEVEAEDSDGDNKMHVSLLQQANCIKTEVSSSSKFKKTGKVDKKVSVVSRFFSPKTSVKSEEEVPKTPETRDCFSPLALPLSSQEKTEEVVNDVQVAEKETAVDTMTEEVANPDEPAKELEPEPPVDTQTDSEEMGTSAMDFVSTQYSMASSSGVEADLSDSQKQRENEQSPVPWQSQQINDKEEEEIVPDTIISSSQQSDKENKQAINKDNNNNGEDEAILILSDDDTPVKKKPPVVAKPRTNVSPKGQAKKTVTAKTKQKTLMSFFHKK